VTIFHPGVAILNERADRLVQQATNNRDALRIGVSESDGATLLDFGVSAPGGIQAGLLLARICMSDLAEIRISPADAQIPELPQVFVHTDLPIEACLMSQYAGWKISPDGFFAMGSGPMRAAARKEALFEEFAPLPSEAVAVGVLESGSMPNAAAIQQLQEGVGSSRKLSLAVAPTASQAGNIQVVARSVETALHKLHELKFPLDALCSGSGCAPLPPIAKNDLHGIGRTNDSILYGATVNLWVRTDDELIDAIGPKVPSSSSSSHGQTFLSLFKAANYDFYALDPALFSPAVVVFHNMKTGRTFSFGHRVPTLLRESFGLAASS
jgi:methenyltetrahydromethanopterin cyclohydrolase